MLDFRKNKNKYEYAIMAAVIVIGTYWISGFLMYVLCISIITELELSSLLWLIPCLILGLVSFFTVLFLLKNVDKEK